MTVQPGDVVLVELQGSGGGPPKLRPAVVLAALPGAFQQHLIAGISSQRFGLVRGWDEWISPNEPRYAEMGLKRASAVRLSYLEGIVEDRVKARLGQCRASDVAVYRARIARLLARGAQG